VLTFSEKKTDNWDDFRNLLITSIL